MKKTTSSLMLIAAICLSFQSCVKDSLETTYTYFEPVYKSKAEVWQQIKSDPAMPLKQTGKLYIYKQYLFVNEVNKGVHVIDNANPNAPRNIAFIPIPNNVDVAVKDNILYADLGADIASIDIQDPMHVVLKKITSNVFPERFNYALDTSKYIVDWVKKTTTDKSTFDNRKIYEDANVLYSASANSSGGTNTVGVGGSMARFTIVDNYLYTVSRSDLSSFNISLPANPQLTGTYGLGWNIETIYPLKDKLFIGSQTGMFIFDIQNPSSPSLLSTFSHACFRDPVIADDHYAYVTLRATETNSPCWGAPGDQRDQLDVIDISNMQQPMLVKIYDMTSPTGLSKDGNYLFICDGAAGVKIYDAANVHQLTLLKTLETIDPFDVICQDGIAIIVAAEGIYQYDYTDINDVKLISKLTIQP